jgi:hypothetical protein
MEVDKIDITEDNDALLLEGGADEAEPTEFTSGDVELLLGDEDENAFANESYDTNEDATEIKVEGSGGVTEVKAESGESKESNYYRGRGGRPYYPQFRGGRGYRPPHPGFFPRGMRPPFPGAIPRFSRHPPPYGYRGRLPMRPPNFMRHPPRGMFLRGMRPQFHEEEEEEEEEETTEEAANEDGDKGPKSLMSIKTPKDVRDSVKTQLRGRGSQLMVPLGMGMGPRYHAMRGMRPPGPPGPPPPGHPANRGRGGGPDSYDPRARHPLKRPAPSGNSHHYDGPRPKMMMMMSSHHQSMPPPPIQHQPGIGMSSRSNLRQIQTVDEPMHTAPSFQSHQHHTIPSHHRPPPQTSGGGGGFIVAHKPAPTLTQIRMVDSDNSNLRSIPTIGSAPVPTPMSAPRITKAGGTSNRVMISNLPPTMSFERISAMTTACGNVRTVNVNENGTAIVEFANPAGAENFIRANNRKMIDRSMISVARLA